MSGCHNGQPDLGIGKVELTGDTGSAAIGDSTVFAEVANAVAHVGAIQFRQLWSLAFLTPALLQKSHFPSRASLPNI